MAKKSTANSSRSAAASREDRLKAALKANLARRKVQSRERKATEVSQETKPDETGQDKDS